MQEIQGQIDQKLSHVKVHSLPLEIGNDASQNEFCQRMQEEFGGSLDVLVNNAGRDVIDGSTSIWLLLLLLICCHRCG